MYENVHSLRELKKSSPVSRRSLHSTDQKGDLSAKFCGVKLWGTETTQSGVLDIFARQIFNTLIQSSLNKQRNSALTFLKDLNLEHAKPATHHRNLHHNFRHSLEIQPEAFHAPKDK
jgi:hypothetical protein